MSEESDDEERRKYQNLQKRIINSQEYFDREISEIEEIYKIEYIRKISREQ